MPKSFALENLYCNEVNSISGELTKQATLIGGFTMTEEKKIRNMGVLLKRKEAR